MTHFRLCFLLLSSFLTGCATLSEQDCLTGDWYGIGYADGEAGRSERMLEGHRKACLTYGIKPVENRYFLGRERGLLIYCTAQNGLQEGLSGDRYLSVCPPHLETDFLKSYQRGHKIFEIKRSLSQIESDIHLKESKLDNTTLTVQEKRKLERDVQDLRDEKNLLKTTLIAMDVVDIIQSY